MVPDQQPPRTPPPYAPRHAVTEQRQNAGTPDRASTQALSPSQAQSEGAGDSHRITHLRSHFQGGNLDIYWDDTRTAVRRTQDPDNAGTPALDSADSPNGDTPHPTASTLPADIGRELKRERVYGTPVVGPRPERSPSDLEGRPPSGQELLEESEEDEDASLTDKFRRKFGREVSDVADSGKQIGKSIHDVLSRPAPSGHTEQPPKGPVFNPIVPGHIAPDAGSIVELGVVGAVIVDRAADWLRRKLAKRKGDANARH
jgi:hypothetical protein